MDHQLVIQDGLKSTSHTTVSIDHPMSLEAAQLVKWKKHYDRIMLAEDDPIFRRVLQVWLTNWGYHVTVADDGAKAWQILQSESSPQLLVLDWVMPGIDGPELCRRIRGRRDDRYHYILLLTAKDSSKDVVAGLEAGADDYIPKPFETSELRARIDVGRRVLTLQSELMLAQEELRHQAAHDPLTGSWSRAAILDLFHKERQRSIRTERSTGLLMLDFDHFKQINDTYGHLVGDAVLVEAIDRITEIIRPYDSVGRYGGEEFLVVLPDCTPEHISQLAERVRLAIAERPFVVGQLRIPVTVSIGAARDCLRGAGDTVVLSAADAALYRAKADGRNRTVVS